CILEYLQEHQTDIPQERILIFGFSAGALAAPTIAARLHDRVSAMILVCGGANLLDITLRSTARRSAVQITIAGRPLSGAHTRALAAQSLARVRLDPWHTAPYCADIPTLVVHGSTDRIVPADTGEVLWQRLGRPERWTCAGGHILAIAALQFHQRELVK